MPERRNGYRRSSLPIEIPEALLDDSEASPSADAATRRVGTGPFLERSRLALDFRLQPVGGKRRDSSSSTSAKGSMRTRAV